MVAQHHVGNQGAQEFDTGSAFMQASNNEDVQGRRWKAFFATALISASVGAATPGDVMPKATAEESAVERRRAEANKRKELLLRAYVAA